MPSTRSLSSRSTALAAIFALAGCASGPAKPPPSPFGPQVERIALRYVDAPDSFRVRGEGVDIAGLVFTVLLLGPAIGGGAALSDDLMGGDGDKADAQRLVAANAETLAALALPQRVAADAQRLIERNGWARVVGPLAAVAAEHDGIRLVEESDADAVLVLRPRLQLEERARYLRLHVAADLYLRQPTSSGRHLYEPALGGTVSVAIDGKRTPPKTLPGQIADYGGRWFADGGAKLRTTVDGLVERELARSFEGLGRVDRYRDWTE